MDLGPVELIVIEFSGGKLDGNVASAPTGMTDEKIAQLTKLSELQKAGVLTDEEFAAQKAKILGS